MGKIFFDNLDGLTFEAFLKTAQEEAERRRKEKEESL